MAEASPPARPDIAKYVVLAIGALLTAAIVVIIVWSTSKSSGRADVRGRVAIVEVVSDRLLAVTVEVEKAPLASAACDVSAFDKQGVSVGRLLNVAFGPNTDNQRLTTVSVDVPTPLGRGATAQVATCRITRTR
ncbi:MAG: hypothetical protein QOG49_608 [Frankiaceae bacterium]|nr:hypothetical protein [Frankiaceae bacterium]